MDRDRFAGGSCRTQYDVNGTESIADGEFADIILEELASDLADVDSGGQDDHGLDGFGAKWGAV